MVENGPRFSIDGQARENLKMPPIDDLAALAERNLQRTGGQNRTPVNDPLLVENGSRFSIDGQARENLKMPPIDDLAALAERNLHRARQQKSTPVHTPLPRAPQREAPPLPPPEHAPATRDQERPKKKWRLGKKGLAAIASLGGLTAVLGGGAVDQLANQGNMTETFAGTVAPMEAPGFGANQEHTSAEYDNAIDFAASGLYERFIEARQERVAQDPAATERIAPELLNQHSANIAVLVSDYDPVNRPDDLSRNADAIKLLSCNGGGCQTVTINRDTYSPEVLNEVNRYRVNGVIANGDNPDLIRQTLESATGMPVDMIVRLDVRDIPTLVGQLFPDGLTVNVPETIHDDQYPAENYGFQTVHFDAGEQVLSPEQITQYMRVRHGGTDFDRGERQSVIINAMVGQLFSEVTGGIDLEQIKNRDPGTLADLGWRFVSGELKSNINTTGERIIRALEETEANGTIFIDSPVPLSEMARTYLDYYNSLGPLDLANVAAQLGRDTYDSLGSFSNKQIGFAPEEMVTSVYDGTNGSSVDLEVQVPAESQGQIYPYTTETANGNFLDYWKPLRDKVRVSLGL
jgi:hypothetical protein